jgi:hypothetical protein
MTEAGRIDLSVREIRQLFHSLDPSPFYDRDLDDDAAAFIVDSARIKPAAAALSLRVHAEQPPELPDPGSVVEQAVHAHFTRLAEQSVLALRRLFVRGRASLAIGIVFLAAMLLAAEFVGRVEGPFAPLMRESLMIAGWVAMWRPMEIFLYDWWPIRADRKLYLRLAAMPVEILQGTVKGERGTV